MNIMNTQLSPLIQRRSGHQPKILAYTEVAFRVESVGRHALSSKHGPPCMSLRGHLHDGLGSLRVAAFTPVCGPNLTWVRRLTSLSLQTCHLSAVRLAQSSVFQPADDTQRGTNSAHAGAGLRSPEIRHGTAMCNTAVSRACAGNVRLCEWPLLFTQSLQLTATCLPRQEWSPWNLSSKNVTTKVHYDAFPTSSAFAMTRIRVI